MRKANRGLALILIVMMLISAFPFTAMAEGDQETLLPMGDQTEEKIETKNNEPYRVSDDTVIFNTQYLDVTVGSDAEFVETAEIPYTLFNEDGSYTIELYEEAPLFPYEVQFTYQGVTTTEWFVDENDCVIVGGHPFYVSCLGGQPNHIGFQIGGDYVLAYPEEKTFVNNPDAGIAPISLLPLETKNLYVDFSKYLSEELREVKLSALLTNQNVVGNAAVVWSRLNSSYDGIGAGQEYTVTTPDGTIDFNAYARDERL